MDSKHPIIRILRVFIKDIDENPKIQLRIHTFGFYYWTINFPAICYLFFYQPDAWAKYGIFITLIYSIYANWTSDYTGMSSAQSVINTGDKPEAVGVVPFPGTGIVVTKEEDK